MIIFVFFMPALCFSCFEKRLNQSHNQLQKPTNKTTLLPSVLSCNVDFIFVPYKKDEPTTAIHVQHKNFGAIGDGKTNNVLAIQKTIGALNAAGGAMVSVPAGRVYLTAILM